MEQNKNYASGVEAPMAVRNYKDTLFRMIFKEKKQLLMLYNAVNGTNYEDLEELEIITLENAVYMNIKNDLAFIMNFQLHLYEHQSTVNPNLPLRDLIYVSCELQRLVDKKTLYSRKLTKIPTPQFVVFYNGVDEHPEKSVQRLSDAFEIPMSEPELELKVLVLNINCGHNADIMESCQTLRDYSIYVQKVRDYAEKQPLNQAVERAVDECIKEGILEEFLREYKSEVIRVSIFEYDEEKEMRLIRQDEREAGKEEGIRVGIEEKLCELVGKKLSKGKTIEIIAEELEETPENIRQICERLDEKIE